ncbi:hypothetical protein [Marinicrinis sediminis]|uniref:Uncharacterized protein n=1 Tax=Marinicrinis sediminis TaxID=1652465 RepID=A0ABW5RAL3_9BACL
MTEPVQPDKNLQNVVDDLDHTPVNSHQAQQLRQDHMDRRKQSMQKRQGYKENEHQYQ